MALSIYDQTMLSKEDQAKIENIQAMWNSTTDPTQRTSLHNMAEGIRATYGYSGNVGSSRDGGGYTNIGLPQPKLGNYESPYADLINNTLSGITNRDPFSYDQNTDEAYQAFLGKVNRMAETTFNDSIVGMSVGTGGRPNSWAGTVASNAMGSMLMQGAEAMPQFRDMAYKMYQDEGQLSFQQLEALMGLDSTAYGRFMDEYSAELNTFNMAISQRETRIAEALERTRLTGYVSNSDALVLGVPSGTPSQEAMERAWDMEDYLTKARIENTYLGGDDGGGETEYTYLKESATKYDDGDIWNKLKGRFGTKDGGKLDVPATELEPVLTAWVKAGYISVEQYESWCVDYGITPQQLTETPTSTTPISDAELDRLLQQRSSLQDKYELIKIYVQQGRITEAQAEKALKNYGIPVPKK